MKPDDLEQIIASCETERVEFKKTLSIRSLYQKAEFIKDMMAMVNGHSASAGYILIGVGESNDLYDTSGSLPDDAVLQEIIFNNLSPLVSFLLTSQVIHGKRIGIIEIPPSNDRFHIATKDIKENDKTYLRVGDALIRQGTSKRPIAADDIRRLKEDHTRDSKPRALLDVTFVGSSKMFETIRNGWQTPDHVLKDLLTRCLWPPQPLTASCSLVPVRFYIHNRGRTQADNIVVEIQFPENCQVILAPRDERDPKDWRVEPHRMVNRVSIYGAHLVHGTDCTPREIYVRFYQRNHTYPISWKAWAGNIEEPTIGWLNYVILPNSE